MKFSCEKLLLQNAVNTASRAVAAKSSIPALEGLLLTCGGESPFEPDKNHINHKFLAMGFTPRKAMITILLISCAFSAVNILFMPYVNNTIMLIGDITVWVGRNLWFDLKKNRNL